MSVTLTALPRPSRPLLFALVRSYLHRTGDCIREVTDRPRMDRRWYTRCLPTSKYIAVGDRQIRRDLFSQMVSQGHLVAWRVDHGFDPNTVVTLYGSPYRRPDYC